MLIFLIDGFTKVTDKDAAVYTRKIALEEGIFVVSWRLC
jgi:cystathionine beta-synthase